MKIKLEYIVKSFNGLSVFRGINLTFRDNGCYCLIGPSSSGKTTLLRILIGLEQPDKGTLKVDTKPAAVSVVFQEDRLYEPFSSMENITTYTDRSMKTSRVRWETAKLLPEKYLSRPISTSSGGMRRRVAVPKALLTSSHVLLMDESFTRVDEGLKHSVIAYIREKQSGRILILPTRQEEDMELIGEELIRLAQGQYR